MHDGEFAEQALAAYLAKVREGTEEIYFHYRVVEQGFRCHGEPDGTALVLSSVKKVLAADPFFLVTGFPHGVELLSKDDVEAILSGWQLADADLANFLTGKLWHDSTYGPEPDAELMRRALAALLRVGSEKRDAEWHRLVSDAYSATDYDAYKMHFPVLLEHSDPEWHSFSLVQLLREASGRGDWDTYREYRSTWDKLPKNANFCDCYFNDLANSDGMLALHEGRTDDVPELLRRAVDVHGCPHLNSGGPRLWLVAELLTRELMLDECGTYLDAARRFHWTEKAAALEQRLTELRGRQPAPS